MICGVFTTPTYALDMQVGDLPNGERVISLVREMDSEATPRVLKRMQLRLKYPRNVKNLEVLKRTSEELSSFMVRNPNGLSLVVTRTLLSTVNTTGAAPWDELEIDLAYIFG